jgi:hypothetical protein
MIDKEQESPAQKAEVEFDTDQRHEIIEKENLPLKKIALESIDEFKDQELPLEEQTEPGRQPTPAATLETEPNEIGSSPDTRSGAKDMEFLRSLEDQSRMTLLQEIQMQSDKLTIDLKDGGSELLNSINLSIKPGIKKINLILELTKQKDSNE